MPKHFSIEHGQLHYVAQEVDTSFDQEGPEPEQVDEEEEEHQEHAQQEAYTTYAYLRSFQRSIDDMGNLVTSLRGTSSYMNTNSPTGAKDGLLTNRHNDFAGSSMKNLSLERSSPCLHQDVTVLFE